ncbi:MAG: PAS domain S-box protein [Desulfarculaceae bacterium]|nr:PAS domain S-box protein [Desulfarculaceae bacterium]MCF8072691.1 PAS domain S-box protein [Desulfarculaceae bacterium]MCF8102570.1 PAS domain S-box protein [Desulfarculaceae bacterium]MCF8116479.1 PAS domain S-box protein [Desulfarculaceae bacterium]
MGVAAVCFVASQLGLILSTVQGNMTLLWPPAGLALAALLLWGPGMAPAVALGVLAATAASGAPWPFCLLTALGAAAGPLIGWRLLQWQGLDNTLERVRDVVDLAVWGGLAGGMVSATAGALALWAGGLINWQEVGQPWLSWWLGDSVGVVLITPVVLAWSTRPAITWRPPRIIEGALWLVSYLVIIGVVFSGRVSPSLADALDFLPFPLIFWAALRFGRRLTTVACLFICYAAVGAATAGVGPFSEEPGRQAALLLWAYLGALSLGALCLAASLGQTRRALTSLAGHRDALAQAVKNRTAELEQAARALADSEERYRTLVEKSPLGVALIEADGNYLYLNPGFTRLTGYTMEDLPSGAAWFRLAFPDRELRQEVIATWQQELDFAEPGQVRPRTYPVMCKDGSRKQILFRPVTLSGGEQLMTCEDVSQQEQAARVMAESEERHRALLDSLQEGVVLVGRDGSLLSWNRAAARITGFDARRMLGRNTREAGWPLYLPDGSPCPPENLPSSLVLASGEPVSERLYIYKGDNGERWLSTNGQPLFQDDSGKPTAASISFTDVTESREAHQALKASEAKFRLLADNMADVVWTLDRDRRFTYVSPSVQRLLGYDLSELHHLSPRVIMPSNWQDAATQIKQQMRAMQGQDPAKASLVVENLLQAKDGRQVMVESLIRRLYNDQGEFIGYTGASRDVTERKLTEQALKASEEKFSRLYMTSPVWMSLNRVDDGVYLEVNQAFEQITGYSRDEAVGKASVQLGLWPDPAERSQVVDMLKAQGSLHQKPMEFCMRSGERRRFLWSSELITLQDDQVMLNVLLDVTELERAEQALAESEQSFRTVVENSLAGIYVIQGGRFTYVNPRLAQMLGYDSPGELRGAVPWDLVHPEDREMVRNLGSAREEHHLEPNCYTFRVMTKDGGVLWLETMGAHAQYRGAPANVGNVIDITQRKAAEQALKESEEQYRLLVSTAQDAIYIIQGGKLVFANPMVERITGRSARELSQTSFAELLHPDDLDLATKRYQQRLAGEKAPDNYPMRVVATDGKTRWIQASAVPLTWKGRPAILYVARDTTEQRRMEARLRQSQKLEAVGTLAGGIAHDFNNILAAIMGYTELSLAEAPAGSHLAENLDEVLIASKRARDLVRQILSFSRQSKHQLRPLALAEAVEEVLRLIRASIPSNVALEADLESRARVMADPVQIHQLLMNLCANAAQALEDSGGTIWINLREEELSPDDEAVGPALPAGPYLLLSVADDGPGVPPEVRDRIFEPFFTTKETGRGSGLGLSAAHGIVQGHQGAIRLEDRPGGGTVFRVLLPEVDQDYVEEAPLPEPPRAKDGERVMFVDDEPSLVEIARHILSRLGYRVDGYTSSTEALAAFQAQPDAFDLVITDQTMPSMTGAALVREIKELRPELPVIIATGFSRQLSPEQARQAGVAAFVMKPITSQEIAHTVRRVLDGEWDG